MTAATALLTMLLGGMLYLAGRPQTLLMFVWADSLGVGGIVDSLRASLKPAYGQLPPWALYSLPQGLWYASGILSFQGIWGARERHNIVQRRSWIAVFSAIAIGAELGQFLGAVPGVFDPVDMGLLLAAALAALLLGNLFERLEGCWLTRLQRRR